MGKNSIIIVIILNHVIQGNVFSLHNASQDDLFYLLLFIYLFICPIEIKFYTSFDDLRDSRSRHYLVFNI